MKFLQRPHEHQDELLANDAAPRQSKKSKQQLREEEISAYFVKKPAPEGAAPRKRAASGGLQTNVSKYVVHRSTDQRRPTSSKLDANPAGDAVDLLQRPFLGTRSKVPNHHSNTNDPSSHLTWSESVAQRRSPRESLSHADHRATDERARDRDQGRLPTKDPGGEGLKQSRNLDTTTNEKGDRWIEIGRARRQENLERYVLADNEQATARRGTDQSAASITEFLRDSRAKQANSRSSKLSNCDETRDHRTSDVLMIIDDDRVIEPSIQPRHQHSDERQNRSSTPTSDLLRRAFDAVNNATANKPSQLDRTQPIGQGRMESRQRQGEVNIHDTGHRPASHAHGSHAANAEEHATVPRRGFSRAAGTQNTQHRRPLQSLSASKMNAGPRWRPPTGLISSTHKQHRTRDDILDDIQGDFSRSVGAKDARQRQPYQPMSASTMNASPQRRPPSKFERVQMMHHERLTEDDMPDNLQDAAPTRSPGSYVYPDNRFVQSQEVDLHQPIPHERDQIYVDLPARQLVTYSPKFGADLLSVRGPSSGLHGAALSNLSTDRLSGLPSSGENDEVQRADDGMDGFWRPNVLY